MPAIEGRATSTLRVAMCCSIASAPIAPQGKLVTTIAAKGTAPIPAVRQRPVLKPAEGPAPGTAIADVWRSRRSAREDP